jgi:hypothetical protein
LQTLIDVYGALSQGPPTAAHRREAAEIAAQLDQAMARVHHFISP